MSLESEKKKKEYDSLFDKPGPLSLGGMTSTHLDTSTSEPPPYQPSTREVVETPTAYPEPEYSTYSMPGKEAPAVQEPSKPLERPASVYTPSQPPPQVESSRESRRTMTDSNASTSWSPIPWRPRIQPSAFIHPNAVLTGNVRVEGEVFIAAGAVIRGENDEPIYIGPDCNIQEGVILKDLPSKREGSNVSQRIVEVGSEKYSLYIGPRVSVASQAQIHGPAYIGEGVYVGMQSLVFWARIEKGVIIEPGCLVMNVTIPSGHFIPAGLKVTTQKVVADLPPLTSKYRFFGIGEETVEAHLELLRGYRSLFH